MVQSATAGPPPFDVRPGATQLEVLDATTIEGNSLTLLRDGTTVTTGTVDSQGSLVFRQLTPGSYTVRSDSPAYESAAAQVTAFDAPPPAQSFYQQPVAHTRVERGRRRRRVRLRLRRDP